MPDCGVHYLWFAFVCFLIRSHPPPTLARATPLSEQQSLLFPQLLEPFPTLPFINTPPPLVRTTVGVASVKFWDCNVALSRRGGGVPPNHPPLLEYIQRSLPVARHRDGRHKDSTSASVAPLMPLSIGSHFRGDERPPPPPRPSETVSCVGGGGGGAVRMIVCCHPASHNGPTPHRHRNPLLGHGALGGGWGLGGRTLLRLPVMKASAAAHPASRTQAGPRPGPGRPRTGQAGSGSLPSPSPAPTAPTLCQGKARGGHPVPPLKFRSPPPPVRVPPHPKVQVPPRQV